MILENQLKADINIATAGDNTIIVAPSGTSEYLVIDHINMVPASAVTVQLKDGATSYGGAYQLGANVPYIFDRDNLISLTLNSAFVINLSGAVQVSGFVKYRIINR